jgi:Helix-turn-helix domain
VARNKLVKVLSSFCSVGVFMDERMQFVARRLAGEAMADLCREFGISRRTGYKIFDRYQKCGIQGLSDRRRRPYRSWRSGGFGSALASNERI